MLITAVDVIIYSDYIIERFGLLGCITNKKKKHENFLYLS